MEVFKHEHADGDLTCRLHFTGELWLEKVLSSFEARQAYREGSDDANLDLATEVLRPTTLTAFKF